MAFITVLARHKTVSKFQLRGPTTLGRSMDSDIYIPDVFVSRQHCRFVQRDGQWHIVDTQSRNGIWREGKRANSCLLKPGDLIEIGTIAIRFNAGDSDQPSHPAPLGMGLGVTELVDTVYAHDIRPSHYAKKQKARTAEWKQRVKSRLAERPEEHDFEPVSVIDTEPWKREEWAELDMELQIVAGQDQMTDWQPPIFNPKPGAREAIIAMLAQQGTKPSAASAVASSRPATHEMDSLDEEVEQLARQRQKTKPQLAAAPAQDYAGITFESYTWRDRLKDTIVEWVSGARHFSSRNPQLAAAIVLGIVVLAGGGFKAWQYWQANSYHPARQYTPAELQAMNSVN